MMNLITLTVNLILLVMLPYHWLTFKAFAQSKMYQPIAIKVNEAIKDKLTSEDIPTGEGGFARDYFIYLDKGDQVAIDLSSEDFDSILVLIAEDGTTIAENDDSPDSTSNSLLFTRIAEAGKYIVRVRAFGQTGTGNFKLKITKLQPSHTKSILDK